jgi:hypothetical protein
MIDRASRRTLVIGAAVTLAGGSLDAEESLAGTIETLRVLADIFAQIERRRRP